VLRFIEPGGRAARVFVFAGAAALEEAAPLLDAGARRRALATTAGPGAAGWSPPPKRVGPIPASARAALNQIVAESPGRGFTRYLLTAVDAPVHLERLGPLAARLKAAVRPDQVLAGWYRTHQEMAHELAALVSATPDLAASLARLPKALRTLIAPRVEGAR